MDLATGNTTQLTFGTRVDTYPSWWPDRSRIAFVSNQGGNNDLFVINADGSGLVQLTDTPDDEIEPTVSPDGNTIAYVAATPLEEGIPKWRLYLVSLDGGDPRQLTEGPGDDFYPCWSPDGRFLAFERHEPGGGNSIYLWEQATGSLTCLDLPGTSAAVSFHAPSWLPRTGSFLSLIRFEIEGVIPAEIVVFQVQEEGGRVLLHQLPVAIDTNFIHYTWGPNGEWLIAPVESPTGQFKGRALLRVRVSLTGASVACWECTGLVDAQFLTEGNFYDDFPDWAP